MSRCELKFFGHLVGIADGSNANQAKQAASSKLIKNEVLVTFYKEWLNQTAKIPSCYSLPCPPETRLTASFDASLTINSNLGAVQDLFSICSVMQLRPLNFHSAVLHRTIELKRYKVWVEKQKEIVAVRATYEDALEQCGNRYALYLLGFIGLKDIIASDPAATSTD